MRPIHLSLLLVTAMLTAAERIPVIDTTDLYVPCQDPGDNFDLIMPYGLPEIDLRLVVLDASAHMRDPQLAKTDTLTQDGGGKARDAGFIAVEQLNHIFARRVPWCIGSFGRLRSTDDAQRDIPAPQQLGIELFLTTLREAQRPVHVTVFGSARILAVALNRDPELCRRAIAMVHFCAGAASPPGTPNTFVEWNIALDQHAAQRVLASDLPITLYPCATEKGPFALGPHNGFWQFASLDWIRGMHPRLLSYLAYHLGESRRLDVLRAVEEDADPAQLSHAAARRHPVWETCTWLHLSGRALVRHADGTHRIILRQDLKAEDTDLTGRAIPCRLTLRHGDGHGQTLGGAANDLGTFTWEPTNQPTNRWMYERDDAEADQAALREALPALYTSFVP